MLRRLAPLVARRPLTIALVALLLCLLAATGFTRFSVDSGQGLLVGSQSASSQTYQRYISRFGSDPLVLVFASHNPTAFLLEKNLQRLATLEDDIAHDPAVQSVIGPGTVARSSVQAAASGVDVVLAEYASLVGDLGAAESVKNGVTDQTQLSQIRTQFGTLAEQQLAQNIQRAAAAADLARQNFPNPPPANSKKLDSRELAAEQAAIAALKASPEQGSLQLFAQYLAYPANSTDISTTVTTLGRLASTYGDCNGLLAQLNQVTQQCQIFYDHVLLDLPNCAPANSSGSCPLRQEWQAVLPQPSSAGASGVITIRLKPDGASNEQTVQALLDKIQSQLKAGLPDDSYTLKLKAADPATYASEKQLGALAPTECGGAAGCSIADDAIQPVAAGPMLLTFGVVRTMTDSLKIVLPLALVLMIILLSATFRVRGRLWPLVAACLGTGAIVGLALWSRTPITPAVLAAVPVLLGLGVDYAVQLVSRYDEERRGGATVSAALETVLANTGPATLVAGLATLIGLLALALISGVDSGPLVAVPLIAEFAVLISGGVIISWLCALFVALPLAVRFDGRGQGPIPSAIARDPTPSAPRTVSLARNIRLVLLVSALPALVGWALLPTVPVQTDVQRLLASSLPELQAINQVQNQIGFNNEVDVFLEGQVVGPYDQTLIPQPVYWQCQTAEDLRQRYEAQLKLTFSVADILIGSNATSSGGGSKCVPPATSSPSPSPSPSSSGSATPIPVSPTSSPAATSATPAAFRYTRAAPQLAVYVAASATSPATPAPTATGAPSAVAPPASAAPAPTPTTSAVQSSFLCRLRTLPALARVAVMDIGLPPVGQTPQQGETTSCPPHDPPTGTALGTDLTPIDPSAARIVLGVSRPATFADEAALIDSIRNNLGSPPNGIRASITGLPALAAAAYDNVTGARAYFLNLTPIVVVLIALLLVYRRAPRRALLPVLPTVMAAGWVPIVMWLLDRVNDTVGSFSPLSVVMGALIVALATEFGVVLLNRFYEERARGLEPEAAAAAALRGVGRAICTSSITLGGGFAVLAVSALLPSGLPLLGAFGLGVVVNLALAVTAVFAVMLPAAVAWERHKPLALGSASDVVPQPSDSPPGQRRLPRAPKSELTEPKQSDASTSTTRPTRGVSGRRRSLTQTESAETLQADDQPPSRRRTPGVSGRRRSASSEPAPPGGPEPPAPKRRRAPRPKPDK